MAGKDDDIERLLAEMQDLTAQADAVLGGDDSSGKTVSKRSGSQPVPTAGEKAEQPSGGGMPPVLFRALATSGVATGLVWLAFVLLPFIGLPLTSLVPVFLACMVVASFYEFRQRRRGK